MEVACLTIMLTVAVCILIAFVDWILLFLGYVFGTIFGLPIHLLRTLFKKTLNYDFLEGVPTLYENEGSGLFPHGFLGVVMGVLTILVWKIIENLPYFMVGAITLTVLIIIGNLTFCFISSILKIKTGSTNILLRAITGNIILSVFVGVVSLIIYYFPSYIEFIEVCKRIFG